MTAAERIAEIINGMTPAVRKIVEYDAETCAVSAFIRAVDFSAEDAQHAAEAMFRMAAMARAAEAAAATFGGQLSAADAQSLDDVTKLRRAGMFIAPKALNSPENAREFLAADARRVGL